MVIILNMKNMNSLEDIQLLDLIMKRVVQNFLAPCPLLCMQLNLKHPCEGHWLFLRVPGGLVGHLFPQGSHPLFPALL